MCFECCGEMAEERHICNHCGDMCGIDLYDKEDRKIIWNVVLLWGLRLLFYPLSKIIRGIK